MKLLYTFLLFVITSTHLYCENYLIVNLNDQSFQSYEFDDISEVNVLTQNVAVTGVTLSQTTKTIDIGESFQVEYSIQPDNANNKDVTWSSSDESIASVDQNGLILGESEGEAVITVRTDDGGMTDEISLIVQVPVSVEDIKLDIQLYPNPTEGMLNINMPNNLPFEIIISDLNGNVVFSDYDKNQIELNTFSTGTYFVTIITNNKYYNYQIIKN